MTAVLGTVPEIIYLVVWFIVGTFMGSFVGVLTYRIPREEQWVKGHLVCPACGHALGVLDLVPIWSYVFLHGRCRYCHAHIGVRYLWTEVGTGLLLAGLGWRLGWSIDALRFAIMTVLALAVGIIDFETGLVPDAVVLPGAAIGLVFGALSGWQGCYWRRSLCTDHPVLKRGDGLGGCNAGTDAWCFFGMAAGNRIPAPRICYRRSCWGCLDAVLQKEGKRCNALWSRHGRGRLYGSCCRKRPDFLVLDDHVSQVGSRRSINKGGPLCLG